MPQSLPLQKISQKSDQYSLNIIQQDSMVQLTLIVHFIPSTLIQIFWAIFQNFSGLQSISS